MWASRLARGLAVGGVGVAWWGSSEVEAGWARASRTLCYSALVAFDYKTLPADAQLRKEAIAQTHERSARRLLHVCTCHGGLYTKLGQFVASCTHILPEQYTSTLAVCQDRASPLPFAIAQAAVESELGVPLQEAFESFDPVPLAAASLAQVHRAVAKGGEAVVVKVQYPQLAAQMQADQSTLSLLSWVVERLFPGCGYEWLLPEFEESLKQELDFKREAENSSRAARLLERVPDVYVPRTMPHLSTTRVLTMEFIEGVKLSNQEGLDELHLSRSELSHLLTSVFSVMIFQGGFVHCDPHPGNLLARAHPSTGRPQLVLLDHGLYRELTPDFRQSYCELWCALLTRDHPRGKKAALSLGVSSSDYDFLSLILTFRPADSLTPLGSRLSPKARASVREKLQKLRMADVSDFFERMPRDMLFVMRTWAYVRQLNQALGGTTRGRLKVQGEYAARGMFLAARSAGAGWVAAATSHMWACIHVYRVKLYMSFFDAAFGLLNALRKIAPHSKRDLG